MKTIFATLFALVLSSILIAQEYVFVSNKKIPSYTILSSEIPLSTFTNEVINTTNFKYKRFLSASKKSQNIYKIGQQKLSKEALSRFLRKSALKFENLEGFLQFLNQNNPCIVADLTEAELPILFKKFRQGSFHNYIDGLKVI